MQLFVLVRKSFALSSRSARRRSTRLSGGHAGGDPPVPIPNTAVKPSRADDTATARLWESRTLPESCSRGSLSASPFFFLLCLPYSFPFLPRLFLFSRSFRYSLNSFSLFSFLKDRYYSLILQFNDERYSLRSTRILDIFTSFRLEWEQDSFFPVKGDRDLEKQSLQMTSQ